MTKTFPYYRESKMKQKNQELIEVDVTVTVRVSETVSPYKLRQKVEAALSGHRDFVVELVTVNENDAHPVE